MTCIGSRTWPDLKNLAKRRDKAFILGLIHQPLLLVRDLHNLINSHARSITVNLIKAALCDG